MAFIAIKSFDTKDPLKKKTLLFLKKMGVYVPVAIAVFYLAFRLLMGYFEKECGPNPEDVKVMKPQAEVITNYILENGIPKSLSEIPGLPYGLEGCESKTLFKRYTKYGVDEYFKERSKGGDDGEVFEEKCSFSKENNTYEVKMRFSATYKNDLKFNDENISILNNDNLRGGKGELSLFARHSETGIDYDYVIDQKLRRWTYDNNPFMNDDEEKQIRNPQIYSRKNTGICNPMRM